MIKQLVSDALSMPVIYDKIGIDGAFMDELKRGWLQGHKPPPYPETGRLMQNLSADAALQEQGRWLFSRLPRLPFFSLDAGYVYATHELFLIKEFLFHYGKLQLFGSRHELFRYKLPELDAIFKKLDPEGSASPSFRIGPAFGPVLHKLASQRMQLEAQLQALRQSRLQKACEKLKFKAPGLEFVVSRAERELVSRIQNSRFFALIGESVANLRFKLRDDAQTLKLLARLEKLEARRQQAEQRIRESLSRYIYMRQSLIQRALERLSRAALTFMLADFGIRHNCVIPSLGGHRIRIQAAENLPLKWHLQSQNRRYQPIDMDFEPRGNLITGPNMGGKSCALQTLGQLCRLVQLNLPLPCKSARLPRFDQIWLNQDDSSQGADLSAFGREVVSFSEALQTPGSSLILLDEFARGTNPAEGEALLCAILRYLSAGPHFVVAATHFSSPALMKELAQFAIVGPQLNEALLQKAARLKPEERLKLLASHIDYRLKRLKNGQNPPQAAIKIARLLGLPPEVLKLIQKD